MRLKGTAMQHPSFGSWRFANQPLSRRERAALLAATAPRRTSSNNAKPRGDLSAKGFGYEKSDGYASRSLSPHQSPRGLRAATRVILDGAGYGLFDGLVPRTCARRSKERDPRPNARGRRCLFLVVLTDPPGLNVGVAVRNPWFFDHRRPDHSLAESGGARCGRPTVRP